MDQLKRPLRVPAEFSVYAQEKGVFKLYERMLSQLLVAKPSDPLSFLYHYLSKPNEDAPRVIVYGPPVSGQHSMSKLAARKLRAIHVRPQRVLDEAQSVSGSEARALSNAGRDIPADLWGELISTRLANKDCSNKGWVLEGFPRTREQALVLKAKGVLPKHFVSLCAPDRVLLERHSGKRTDSLTGDVYHLQFHPPETSDVANRLVEDSADTVERGLTDYHRYSNSLLSSFAHISRSFNADQPLKDLFEEVFSFLCSEPRSAAPHTPKVLLLGPTGAGKSLQAHHLAKTYGIVSINCREIIKRTLTSGSKIADKMRPFTERGMMIPDDLVMGLLSQRLSQLDCATKGWVLHGFPLTRDQAELLKAQGHTPNRVFFLNIPEDSVKERLTLRRVDPVTGQRYHLLFKPPPSQEIKERLVTHPRDLESEVLKRLTDYDASIEELVDCYPWAQHINADQDPLTVFEYLESMLINPLPRQPPPILTE